MSEQTYRGQCFCGAIQFSVSGPVEHACFCHCESCRRSTGAPFVAWGSFPLNSLVFSRGKLATYHSSKPVIRGFCANCGTSLSYQHQGRPKQIDITLVTLDPENRPRPEAHIWLSNKEPSIQISDDLPQFSEWRLP